MSGHSAHKPSLKSSSMTYSHESQPKNSTPIPQKTTVFFFFSDHFEFRVVALTETFAAIEYLVGLSAYYSAL